MSDNNMFKGNIKYCICNIMNVNEQRININDLHLDICVFKEHINDSIKDENESLLLRIKVLKQQLQTAELLIKQMELINNKPS